MLDLDLHWQRGFFRLGVKCRLSAPVTGIVGPNGAGKSSLLHLIAGTERPTFGRLTLDDEVLFHREQKINVPSHRRGIATVFQDGRLFPHYSVEGNLRYGESVLPPERRRVRLADVVELLSLRALLKRRVVDLSGGERQRLAIGRALLTSPRLLLMDEPLAALDVGLKRRVLPYLSRIHAALHIPMLYVSHDIGEILSLTQELLVLDEGRVAGVGPFRELINDHDVFRLARDLGMENVITARIVEHRVADGLSRLELPRLPSGEMPSATAPPTLLAPLASRPPGSEATIAVRPEDIAVATQPLSGVSMQNQLVGRVTRMTAHDRVALVEVNVGIPLLVEVSPKAAADLALAPGRAVFLLFKAQGVRYLDETAGES